MDGISSVVTRGVGRRILGLFFLAALLPVIFTAFLAYHEVGRGLEQDVNRELREIAKSYGVSILTRLELASELANEVVRIIEQRGVIAIQDRQYLVRNFASIAVLSPNFPVASIHGKQASPISASAIDFEHLAAGKNQLLEIRGAGTNEIVLLRGTGIGQEDQAIFVFQLRPESIWGPHENLPYLTDFCAFSAAGSELYCTAEMDDSIIPKFSDVQYSGNHRPLISTVGGEEHLAAFWELFLDSGYSHSAIGIVASQPKIYALKSGADFRRVFPPALLLVIVLVGALTCKLHQ